MPQLAIIILDPAETHKLTFWYNCPKLYLTSSVYYCIIGAAKDSAVVNNLPLTCKKDLTSNPHSGKMARATPTKIVVVLLLAPPRQKVKKKKD